MLTMRAGALLVVSVTLCACRPPADDVNWTCDFEASVDRPLSDPGATANEAGELPSSVCGDTCGPPAQSCTFTVLDGGGPGAICPVCTF